MNHQKANNATTSDTKEKEQKGTSLKNFHQEKLEKLKAEILAHGYTFCEIKQFKSHDRIIFGNDKIKLNLKLRGKLSEIALDALVKACLGSES